MDDIRLAKSQKSCWCYLSHLTWKDYLRLLLLLPVLILAIILVLAYGVIDLSHITNGSPITIFGWSLNNPFRIKLVGTIVAILIWFCVSGGILYDWLNSIKKEEEDQEEENEKEDKYIKIRIKR